MSQPTPPPGYYQPPPQGMSTLTKVFLVLGIGGILFSVLICGAAGVLLYSGGRLVGQVVKQVVEQGYSPDPEVARRLTDEIAGIAVPSRFEPGGSFDLRVPNTDRPLFVCAWYTHPQSDGFLALAELDEENTGANREALHDLAKLYLKSNEHEEINVEQAEEREYVVRGQQAWFEVARGHGQERVDKKFVRVLGSFPGRHGPGLFVFYSEADSFDEEEVTKLIESIE